jgi:hypothetical protein
VCSISMPSSSSSTRSSTAVRCASGRARRREQARQRQPLRGRDAASRLHGRHAAQIHDHRRPAPHTTLPSVLCRRCVSARCGRPRSARAHLRAGTCTVGGVAASPCRTVVVPRAGVASACGLSVCVPGDDAIIVLRKDSVRWARLGGGLEAGRC